MSESAGYRFGTEDFEMEEEESYAHETGAPASASAAAPPPAPSRPLAFSIGRDTLRPAGRNGGRAERAPASRRAERPPVGERVRGRAPTLARLGSWEGDPDEDLDEAPAARGRRRPARGAAPLENLRVFGARVPSPAELASAAAAEPRPTATRSAAPRSHRGAAAEPSSARRPRSSPPRGRPSAATSSAAAAADIELPEQRGRKRGHDKAFKEQVEGALGAKGWKNDGYKSAGQKPEKRARRAKKSYADLRTSQLLRHLSVSLFFALKEKVATEQEVQAMFVNGRLLISGNDAQSVGVLEAFTADALDAALRTLTPKNRTSRGKRAVKKLGHVLDGSRLDARPEEMDADETDGEESEDVEPPRIDAPEDLGEAVDLADLLRAAVEADGPIVRREAASASSWLDDESTEGKVVVVSGPAEHAEQNLVIALINSGHKGRAVVRGKKRPCLGCYLTLSFARSKMGLSNLSFNPLPGNFWFTAQKGLDILIRQHQLAAALDEAKFTAFVQTFLAAMIPSQGNVSLRDNAKGQPVVDQGYDSESDSSASESESED